MAVIESAWESHPDYQIDLVPFRGTAHVWHGDVLLAESTSALRIIETDHVERLYFPQDDVRLDLLHSNDHHTICPFKGQADYWSLAASEPPVEDVFWTYRHPFPQVGGLNGYLGVYHEKVRTELGDTVVGQRRGPDDDPVPGVGRSVRSAAADRRERVRPEPLRGPRLPRAKPQRCGGRPTARPGHRRRLEGDP
jgi:acyl-CoA thioesterase II